MSRVERLKRAASDSLDTVTRARVALDQVSHPAQAYELQVLSVIVAGWLDLAVSVCVVSRMF
jgi:hypothetical protein